MLIDLNRSNRAILAAYNNFMSILAACGAKEPRFPSSGVTSDSDLECNLPEYLGSKVLAHHGHVTASFPGAGARAG